MDILAQLAWLDDLIAKHPEKKAEMRNIVASIREQVEAYQQLAVEHAALKNAKAAVDAELAALKPPSAPNWGSQPRIKGRMEQ